MSDLNSCREPIDCQVVDVVFGEPLADRVVLVGSLRVVGRSAEIGGIAGHFRDDL